jgi:hypothetical protein
MESPLVLNWLPHSLHVYFFCGGLNYPLKMSGDYILYMDMSSVHSPHVYFFCGGLNYSLKMSGDYTLYMDMSSPYVFAPGV